MMGPSETPEPHEKASRPMPYDERATSTAGRRPQGGPSAPDAAPGPAQGASRVRAASHTGGTAGSKAAGRAPAGGPRPPKKPIDPSAATIDQPAHPLPAVRTGRIDYDRYLERSTAKFKIFSAEERRIRNRRLAVGLVILLLAVIILIWVVVSRTLE